MTEPENLALHIAQAAHEVTIINIGRGYHPDTKADDYLVPMPRAYDELQETIRSVYEQHGLSFDEESLRLYKKLFGDC